MKGDKLRLMIWFGAISDLFINLSAGWFGAAIIAFTAVKKTKFTPWGLILNIGLGIFGLLMGVFFRSLI